MHHDGLDQRISALLSALDIRNVDPLRKCGSEIRGAIPLTPLPTDLELEIFGAYDSLLTKTNPFAVAVRSIVSFRI